MINTWRVPPSHNITGNVMFLMRIWMLSSAIWQCSVLFARNKAAANMPTVVQIYYVPLFYSLLLLPAQTPSSCLFIYHLSSISTCLFLSYHFASSFSCSLSFSAVASGLHYLDVMQWPLLSFWCHCGINAISISVTCLFIF